MHSLKVTVSAVALAMLGLSAILAQDWPSRPVTMVVPFAAGGAVDTLGRILQPALGQALGQQIVIENAPGGGGTVGSLRVSQASLDSHTFVIGAIGTHAISQSMYKKPPYNSLTDFQPVILLADAPLVLIAKKDLPVSNLKEFTDYVKAHHAKMQFGSGGSGSSSQISCVMLNQTMGVTVTHIPYRGGGPALQDLMAGRIDYMCSYVSTAVPTVQSGKAKAIATLAHSRVPGFPDVPTAHEQGLKDFDVSAWNAIFLPKSATPAMVAQLNTAISKALDNPAVKKRLDEIGLIPAAPARRSSDYLKTYLASEIKKWAEPVKASGLAVD